ncbi:MBL fold metallo-hydrolase RNA specificity domain-containing protein [Halomonas halocynthiae]|uniref:MBL fold metallo-hydrolase RNA specificity domain-containing protein n=1 Tax=Halomonas halocynthiae TaxID=176290 RepID=UPI000421BD31|nr:MBL fold metallo-hydrolase [Halomonas halocynthiae]
MASGQIEHHGAAKGVTGSCHRLRLDAIHSLLVDCGLFQGEEGESGADSTLEQHRVEFPVDDIQAMVVTHVHIDHVGRLPYLLAAGYRGPIYCSPPSAQLLPLVTEDALKIGFTRDTRLIERFLQVVRSRLRPVPYGQWHTVIDNASHRLRIKLKRAGHILGSAYVEVDHFEHRSGKQHRTVFSGDLGAPYSPLLPAPKSPYRADTLVIESTYGDRLHEERTTRRQRLKIVIEKALENQGSVIIPAFSIGRTQELLYELEGLIHQAQSPLWKDLEIIVDSPLAARFTEVYRKLKPWWDAEAHRRVRSGRHPLSFDSLYTVASHKEHLQTVDYLARTGRPAIVIAASGMATGGRVVNYLKRLLGDPKHAVVFVGYQARGTAGRDIQRYGPIGGWVVLDGQRVDIRASVTSLGGYSAHADQSQLLNFIKRMRHPPSHIRLVHGEPDVQAIFKARIEQWASKDGCEVEVTLGADQLL